MFLRLNSLRFGNSGFEQQNLCMHISSGFSSPEPKAQDELLWSPAVCRPLSSVRRPFIPLNDFSSETPGPISSNFMWRLLGDCDPLIKMAAMLIYGKKIKRKNQESFDADSWYIALWTQGLPSVFK